MDVGTVTVKVVPELDEAALDAIADRIQQRLAAAVTRGTR